MPAIAGQCQVVRFNVKQGTSEGRMHKRRELARAPLCILNKEIRNPCHGQGEREKERARERQGEREKERELERGGGWREREREDERAREREQIGPIPEDRYRLLGQRLLCYSASTYSPGFRYPCPHYPAAAAAPAAIPPFLTYTAPSWWGGGLVQGRWKRTGHHVFALASSAGGVGM